MQQLVHIPADIDDLPFPELDDLRHSLRLSQKEACKEAGLNPATYHRWIKWSRGVPGGSRPQPRSIKALRDVLRQRLQTKQPSAAAPADAA